MVIKLTKFFVLTLNILLAELINGYLMTVLPGFRSAAAPFRSTALKMLCTVIIYYPVLHFAGDLIEAFAANVISKSKKAAGSRIGLLIGFSLSLLVLFGLFLKVDYNINLIIYFRNLIVRMF